MSDRTENSRINIYINNAQAQKALNDLSKEYKQIRGEQKKMAVGSKEWLDKQKELNQVTQKMTEFRKSVDIANMSIKQLRDHSRQLRSIRDNLLPGTEEFKRMNKEIEKVDKQMSGLKGGSGGFFDSIKSMPAKFAAYAGAAYAVYGGLKKVIEISREFEKSLSELSAITGATGKDLEFLADAAKKIGRETTTSAKDAVNAFKLIASAKPELLENSVALEKVTRAAVTLAEASGLDLPDAATRLTDALNQFNAPAEEAGRYINVLAEGSKLGAAEIPDITEALLKFGAVARNSNITIEESTALIETLAEKGLKGAEAGTALRNVLLRMSAPETLPKDAVKVFEKFGVNMDVLKDKTLPLNTRLNELKKIANDTGAVVEVFGNENAVAAQNILQSTKRVEELNQALSKEGLNTAMEQAKINTDNLDGSIKKLNNKIDDFALSLGTGEGGLAKGLKIVVDLMSQMADGARAAALSYSQLAMIYRKEQLNESLDKYRTQGGKDFDDYIKKVKEATGETFNLENAYKSYVKQLQFSISEAKKNKDYESGVRYIAELQGVRAKYEQLTAKSEKTITEIVVKEDDDRKEKIKKQNDKHLKDLERNSERYYEALANLDDEEYLKKLDSVDRELLLIDRKYEKLYQMAVEANKDTSDLQIRHAKELQEKMDEVDKKRREEGAKAEDEYGKKTHDADIKIKILKIQQSDKSESQKAKEILNINLGEAKRQIKELESLQYLTPEQKVQLEELRVQLKNVKNEIEKIDDAEFDKILQDIEDFRAMSEQISNELFRIAEARIANIAIVENKELEDYINREEQKKKTLEERLRAGKIGEEEYAAKVNQINAQIDAKKAETAKKQWERERELKISQITTQMIFEAGRLTIQGIAASASGNPMAASYFLGAAAVITEGTMKINELKNSPPPSFGDGGRLPFGAKHSDASGGMYVYDPATGRVVASVEAREGITPSDTVDANEPLFNYMLQNKGRRVTPEVLSTLQPSANYGRAVQNSVLEKSGALNNAVSQKYMPTSERTIQPKEVVVKMVLNDLEDAQNDLAFVKEFNTFD